MAPVEIIAAILPVGVTTVSDPEIVRRRGDDKIDARVRQGPQTFDAIGAAQIERSHNCSFAFFDARTRQKAPKDRHPRVSCLTLDVWCLVFLWSLGFGALVAASHRARDTHLFGRML